MLISKKSMSAWLSAALVVGLGTGFVLARFASRNTTVGAQERRTEGENQIAVLNRIGPTASDVHSAAARPYLPVNGKGGTEISGPYEPVLGWPEDLHPGEWRPSSVRTVYAESPDRVYVIYGPEVPWNKESRVYGVGIFQDLRFARGLTSGVDPLAPGRAATPRRDSHLIVVFDRNGKLVETWGEQWTELLPNVNRLRVNPYDPERHIWIADQKLGKVYKFTRDGKQRVMTLDVAASDELAAGINAAAGIDIAFSRNGEMQVQTTFAVLKFSKDGKYVSRFGRPMKGAVASEILFGDGTAGPGEFSGLHGIEIHPDTGNIYINDRGNDRIQVFDANGKFLDEWPHVITPYSFRLTKDNHLVTAGGHAMKFSKFDLEGRMVPNSTWGSFGLEPGAFWAAHYFDTDSEGNLYIAEDYSGRVQKLRPRKDVDPADPRLVGQLFR